MGRWNPNGKWVLLVGTGRLKESTNEINRLSEEIARALAQAGFGLITGDWPAVDFHAARAYESELKPLGISPADHLKQIAPQESEYHQFVGGEVILCKNYVVSNREKLERADVVIAIGGVGGTLEVCKVARMMRIPVLPIAGTGGDAEQVFESILKEWITKPVKGVSYDDFQLLGRTVSSEDDVREVTDVVMRLVDRVINYDGKNNLACLILVPPEEKFTPIRSFLAKILHEAEVEVSFMDSVIDYGVPVTENIQREIENVDLIIADITGSRPSVMYEIGIAHSLKKPVMLIVQQGEGAIPRHLAGHMYYVYDSAAALDDLKPIFNSWIERNREELKRGAVV